jgi:hypothetical protein
MIFPSLYDQFGFCSSRSISFKLTCLCTTNAGAESLIVDGFNGFRFDINDRLEIHWKIISNLDKLKENLSIENKTLENKISEFKQIFTKVLEK